MKGSYHQQRFNREPKEKEQPNSTTWKQQKKKKIENMQKQEYETHKQANNQNSAIGKDRK